jgi:hypothetical protein
MSGLPPTIVFPALEQATIALVEGALFASVNRQFIPLDNGAAQGPPGLFPPPTVWVEEQHQDQMMITEHPVENGAPVSDHAFPRPVDLTLRLGWKGESLTEIQTLYSQLTGFKDARVLFDIMTGKRLYNNMLIQSIQVATDQRTAVVLMATVRCKQVILVGTDIVTLPQNQAEPAKTATTINNGDKALVPAGTYNPAGNPPEAAVPITLPG